MSSSEANALPPGLSLEQVEEAIRNSGYPLQIDVGNKLAPDFSIQPEWAFVDRNSHMMRALDLMATRRLFPMEKVSELRVRPHLVLLIECKRSSMPYVFFGDSGSGSSNFPHVAGLKSTELSLRTNDSSSTWNLPILSTLGLDRDKFAATPPANCSTLSKCARKGSTIELSGTDPYQGLVLPLRSAVEHFRTTARPSATAAYFDAYLVIGIAVLDAPMLTSYPTADGVKTEFTPWQRLWRHEPLEADAFQSHFGESSALDLVHESFLPTYIDEHLIPFAEKFGDAVMKHATELASGKGFIAGLAKGDWKDDLEPRLRPRGVGGQGVK